MSWSRARFVLFAAVVFVCVMGPGPAPRGGVGRGGTNPRRGMGCWPGSAPRAALAPIRSGSSTSRSVSTPVKATVTFSRPVPVMPMAASARPGLQRIEPVLESMRGHAEKRSWAALQGEARRLAGPGSPPEVRGPAADVERQAGLLAGLTRLLHLFSGPWVKVDAAQVRRDLGSLEGSAGARVRLYLGARARLEGHAELAGELGTARKDAAAVLRDLKVAATSPPPEPSAGAALGPLVPGGAGDELPPADS